MKPSINPQIFREYDIRGIVDKDLTPESVTSIGKAIGTYISRGNGKNMVLGRDVRSSSIEFCNILSKALNSTGCNVIDIGMVPTPVLYFALHYFNADGGVMITGSHNPPEFNGFKISQGFHSLYGDKVQELKRLIEVNDFEVGTGTTQQQPVLAEYMEKFGKKVKIKIIDQKKSFLQKRLSSSINSNDILNRLEEMIMWSRYGL